MTSTIHNAGPVDLLAHIPHQLGFHPTDSLVVVSLRAPRNQVGLIARVDLATATQPGVAESLAGHMRADGASEAVLVYYTPDRRPEPDTTHTHYGQALAAAGVTLAGGWVVTPTGYHPIGRADQVRDLNDLAASRVSAVHVFAGSAPLANRADLGRIPLASPTARATATRAANRERHHSMTHQDALTEFTTWRDHGLDPAAIPAAAGRLGRALEDLRTRDAVLVAMTENPQADTIAHGLVRGATDRVGGVLRDVLTPGGSRPGSRATAAQSILTTVVAHVTPRGSTTGALPGALTLLAFASWWRGDGAKANALIDQALHHNPEYRLAGLIDGLLRAGRSPGWAHPPRP